ncbi:class I SAM-dependent methyltransferase [Bacillaceae bacterium W0354]
MNDHYYSQSPTSQSNPSQFSVTIQSLPLTFHTDEGVFSKTQLDYGTSVLINQFQEPDVSGDLLDVGCGYGPIGITLAKLYQTRTVYMIDINERAIQLAKLNAVENDLNNIKIYQSDGLREVKDKTFAAIITNPPFRAGKQLVHQIVDDSYEQLKVDGEFWVVVQKKQGAPSLKKKVEECFGNAEIVKRDKGYFVIRAKKFD